MLDPNASPILRPHAVQAELITARRVMANLLSEAERAVVQDYVAELERELTAMQWGRAMVA